MYVPYNPNPCGLSTGDCTVRAISKALDISWDGTYAPYTNICPITGHTEASVERDGVNLFPDAMTWELGAYGTAGNKVSADNRVRTVSYIAVRPNTQYTVSFASQHGFIRVCKYDSNHTFLNQTYLTTFTTDTNCRYITLTANTTNTNVVCQLELGSTATPYVPYAGKTYTIALGDTIYGGTVDFDSGVMTVTKGFFTFTGSNDENWSAVDSGKRVKTTSLIGSIKPTAITEIADIISSAFVAETANDTYLGNTGIAVDGASVLYVANGSTMDTASWNAYLANNPLQVCYELATPFTVQFTPQQIQLLKGQNTLTASTGQISVTVNGVSGAIGQVQEQANATDEALAELAADIAEQLPTAPTTDGAYVLTVTVADGTPTYSWESTE